MLPANVNLMRVNGEDPAGCSLQLAACRSSPKPKAPGSCSDTSQPVTAPSLRRGVPEAACRTASDSRPTAGLLKLGLDPGRLDAAPPEHGQGSTLPCSIALGIASTTDPGSSIRTTWIILAGTDVLSSRKSSPSTCTWPPPRQSRSGGGFAAAPRPWMEQKFQWRVL